MREIRIDYENGCVEAGDASYIKKILAKAENGEEITVGFLGGSITQDAVTSKHELCYAYRVYDWFIKKFPNTKINYVNAGIGATDSEFAAARVREQLLSYKPDFILMEHSVNDECTEHFKETYEGVVRQILVNNPRQALLLMCNVFFNDGASAELMHRRVARYYDLPVVSMRSTIYQALLEGRFDNREITQDDLHPNDLGHGIVAQVITTYLDSLLDDIRNLDKEEFDHLRMSKNIREIPDALTYNRYEKSAKYDNRNSTMVGEGVLPENMIGPIYDNSEANAKIGERAPSRHNAGIAATGKYPVIKAVHGFKADTTKQEYVRECFVHGYSATETGSFIEYEVTGSCISLQFRRTIKLPAPIAKCVIDGDEDKAVILDANFDETWGDKLVLTQVYENESEWKMFLESGKLCKHTVRIELIETHPDDKGDFYLAGIIVAG